MVLKYHRLTSQVSGKKVSQLWSVLWAREAGLAFELPLGRGQWLCRVSRWHCRA